MHDRPLTPLRKLCRICAALVTGLSPLHAITLSDLMVDSAMTPRRFAAHFETFVYEYHPEVQWPNIFLAERRGDCDDYAILASHVLRPRGFDARIIHIRLVGRISHVVCYVTETKSYLDYNNRMYALNLQRSGPTLREIAAKVADSFEANWTSVAEVTFDYEKHQGSFGRTVVKTAPRSKDVDRPKS